MFNFSFRSWMPFAKNGIISSFVISYDRLVMFGFDFLPFLFTVLD